MPRSESRLEAPRQGAVNSRLRGLSARWIACWVAIVYGVCGALYVVVTDRLLQRLVTEPARLAEFQTYKTLLLVACTAVLLAEVAYRALKPRHPAAAARAVPVTGTGASLRTHINWLIVAIAGPLVLLLAYLIYAHAREESASARASVQSAARVVAGDSGRFFTTAHQKLAVVARRVAQRGGGADCDPAFDYFSQLNPEFTVLLLWSPQGEVRCPLARRSVRYEDARRPPWLGQALERREPLVSEPYRGPLSGRWITVLAHPVAAAGGEILGVLDLSVDLGNFPPVTLPIGGGVEFLAVIDGRGRIAASAAAEGDAGREAGLVAALPAGMREGSAVARGTDGIERIYAAAPIPGTDWVAVAGVPVDRVFEKANQALVAAMLMALLIVLVSSYLAYRISLAIERPIIITARTAQAVARGDTSVRAPVIGPAETRVVARQFNAMLDGRAESEQRLAELLEQERAARAEAEHARNELAALRDGLESQVAARTRELLERNREMETFSYSVSHDVRAPLRSIHGFATILESDYATRLDDLGRECLRNIHQAVERMDALTTGLISLARLSRVELMPVDIDLSALAHEIVANLRRMEPGREVEVAIAEGLRVVADVTLTRILLDNLLGNAWKYTAPRAQARVAFGHVRDAQGGDIHYVRDNGAGFDMAYAQRLFQPFQRMHRRDEFPGTGIGLATARRIVERHGGRIWAESSPDAGTTIYFTLSA